MVRIQDDAIFSLKSALYKQTKRKLESQDQNIKDVRCNQLKNNEIISLDKILIDEQVCFSFIAFNIVRSLYNLCTLSI